MKLTTKMNPKYYWDLIFKQEKLPLFLNNNSKTLSQKNKKVIANHKHTYKQTCKLKLQYLQE